MYGNNLSLPCLIKLPTKINVIGSYQCKPIYLNTLKNTWLVFQGSIFHYNNLYYMTKIWNDWIRYIQHKYTSKLLIIKFGLHLYPWQVPCCCRRNALSSSTELKYHILFVWNIFTKRIWPYYHAMDTDITRVYTDIYIRVIVNIYLVYFFNHIKIMFSEL